MAAWPTPEKSDLLFWVEHNADLPRNDVSQWTYGDAYTGPGSAGYPDHKLVYVSPQTPDAWEKRFYLSDRVDEDNYNFEFTTGEQLIRTYVVLRSKYFARTAAEAALASPLVADEFTVPVVATLDSRFTKYGFADDTLGRTDTEMDSLYVVVKRRFIKPVTTDYQWNETLEKVIEITKEIIPTGGGAPAASVAGTIVEVQDGNVFHDVQITQAVVLGVSTYPYALPSLPGSYDRRFPPRLDTINLNFAWALASDPSASPSYSEDYYYKFKLTEPRPGPYEATILRFITDDPNALAATYPIDIVPAPIAESIGECRWWASASADGNSTFASAKEWAVPGTIHGIVPITRGGLGGSPASTEGMTTLAATPGYSTFVSLIAGGTMTVDFNVRKVPLGLYEVSVIQIDISQLYDTP